MLFKLGVIGHGRNIKKVVEVSNVYFTDIEITEIQLVLADQIDSIVKYLHAQEQYFDGIIFTGKIPYDLMNHAMHSKTPWVYIDQNHSQLQRTLLEASFLKQYDLLNVSIDSYDKATVYNAYSEVGIDCDQLTLRISELDIFDPEFLNDLKAFHIHNYNHENSSFCITGVSSIYEALISENIPCMLLNPTVDTIKQTIHSLKLKKRSQVNEGSQIVALSIEIDLGNAYSLINENEYQVMLEKTKITEEIYLFAQRIQAAVIEVGVREYLLFSTKNIIELETKNMQNLTLLKDIEDKTFSTVSVGIGFGVTAREAKYNANLGMQRSKRSGGNQAFSVIDGIFEGPMTSVRTNVSEVSEIIDSTYQTIADASGISINTIFRLHCIMDENKKDCFTSKELADQFGNSNRSMNRILEKLELAGYVEVVGKKVVEGAGRPSRIVKLKL